ncbi:hypothetical protein [Actinomadura chibensis]|uniref:Uncharacterized protein n=1 Tax=Actinomadura chibensis TaxID=392828 RepID=A0A5D0NVQ5_9ACTN|nr:hypothetical protein [Actinomadura chibensis]TYB48091.1 hypothetical protein FXF69_02360 [Actinomadura chibensis]
MTEWDGESLARLRAAAHRGDGRDGLGALRGRPLAPVLQYAGDVLAFALAEHEPEPDAEPLARACLDALEGRGLPGDPELAADLAAALGRRPAPPLVPLPADLGAVAAALDDGGSLLDLERGDVVPADEADDPAADPAEEADRWLPIPPLPLPEGEDARRGAARGWLAAQGYRPAPRTL